jgi:hypothetical protein
VDKQLRNGAADSISSFYQLAVDVAATDKLRRR